MRELHVYGQAAALGEKSDSKFQHRGFGSLLLTKAEEIAKKERCKKIKVISGIGVRQYYKKQDYALDRDEYMVKSV